MAQRAAFPPGEAREGWAIIRALSGALDAALPFNTLGELRAAMFAEIPHLAALDTVPDNAWKAAEVKPLGKGALKYAISDFYLTNPIARASAIMAEVSKSALSAKMAAE